MTVSDGRLSAVIKAETGSFQRLLEKLGPAELAEPSGVGDWSRRDLAAHVAASAGTYADWIERALDGVAEPPAGRTFARGEPATSAIAARGRSTEFPEGVLSALANLAERLDATLFRLLLDDYSRAVFHPTGVVEIRDLVRFRIAELSLHRWDMEAGMGRDPRLSEDASEVLCDWTNHWLRICFAMLEPGKTAVIYRFEIAGMSPVTVTLQPDGLSFDDSEAMPDATFSCDAETYVLFVAGRLSYDEAVNSRRMRITGSKSDARAFRERFPPL